MNGQPLVEITQSSPPYSGRRRLKLRLRVKPEALGLHIEAAGECPVNRGVT